MTATGRGYLGGILEVLVNPNPTYGGKVRITSTNGTLGSSIAVKFTGTAGPDTTTNFVTKNSAAKLGFYNFYVAPDVDAPTTWNQIVAFAPHNCAYNDNNYVQLGAGCTSAGGGASVLSQSFFNNGTIPLFLVTEGFSDIVFAGGNPQDGVLTAFQVNTLNNSVNYITVNPAVSGSSPYIVASGPAANIPLSLYAKGASSIFAQSPLNGLLGVFDGSIRVASSITCTGCTSATLTGGVIALVIPTTVSPVTCEYHASLFGSDVTGTGSVSNPWATITHSNIALTAGCILYMGPGNWTEAWTPVDGATYIGAKAMGLPFALYGDTIISGVMTPAGSANFINLHFNAAQTWTLSTTAVSPKQILFESCGFTAAPFTITATASSWSADFVSSSVGGGSAITVTDMFLATRGCFFSSLVTLIGTGPYSNIATASYNSLYNAGFSVTANVSVGSNNFFTGGYISTLTATGFYVAITATATVTTYVALNSAPATINTPYAQSITVAGVSTGQNFLGVGTTPIPLTLGPGVNCGSTVQTQTYIGNNQYMILSVTTPVTGTCTGTIATLTFGAQTGINNAHMCNVMPGTTGSAGVAVAGTTTTFSFGTPTGGLLPNTAYIWYITGCGGF